MEKSREYFIKWSTLVLTFFSIFFIVSSCDPHAEQFYEEEEVHYEDTKGSSDSGSDNNLSVKMNQDGLGNLEYDKYKKEYINEQSLDFSDSNEDYPPIFGNAALGKGHDKLKDKILSYCMGSSETNNEQELILTNRAPRVKKEVLVTTNDHKIRKFLGISAQASLKLDGFSGEGMFDFIKNKDQQNRKVKAIVKIKAYMNNLELMNPVLNKNAMKIVNSQSADRKENFLETCGHEYVSSVTTGGEMYLVFFSEYKNVIDKLDLTAKVSAVIDSVNVSLEGEVNIENSDHEEVMNMQMYSYVVGASDIITNITSFDQIETAIKSFLNEVQGRNDKYMYMLNLPSSSYGDGAEGDETKIYPDQVTGTRCYDPNDDGCYQYVLKLMAQEAIRMRYTSYGDVFEFQAEENKRRLKKMYEIYNMYDYLTQEIQLRQLFKTQYEGMADDESDASKRVELARNEVDRSIDILKMEIEKCQNGNCEDFTGDSGMEKLQNMGMIDPNAILNDKNALPPRLPFFPRSCRQIYDNFTVHPIELPLFIGGNKRKPYHAYCLYDTTAGKEAYERDHKQFAKLMFTHSVNEDNLNYLDYTQIRDNFSTFINEDEETLTTIYEAIQVKDAPGGLKVIPGQSDFQITRGGKKKEPAPAPGLILRPTPTLPIFRRFNKINSKAASGNTLNRSKKVLATRSSNDNFFTLDGMTWDQAEFGEVRTCLETKLEKPYGNINLIGTPLTFNVLTSFDGDSVYKPFTSDKIASTTSRGGRKWNPNMHCYDAYYFARQQGMNLVNLNSAHKDNKILSMMRDNNIGKIWTARYHYNGNWGVLGLYDAPFYTNFAPSYIHRYEESESDQSARLCAMKYSYYPIDKTDDAYFDYVNSDDKSDNNVVSWRDEQTWKQEQMGKWKYKPATQKELVGLILEKKSVDGIMYGDTCTEYNEAFGCENYENLAPEITNSDIHNVSTPQDIVQFISFKASVMEADTPDTEASCGRFGSIGNIVLGHSEAMAKKDGEFKKLYEIIDRNEAEDNQ